MLVLGGGRNSNTIGCMVRKLTLAATKDAPGSAQAAGLRYTHDDVPGIRRIKSGRSFRYQNARGKPVKLKDLKRIRSLVIPPASPAVWISTNPSGHLPAPVPDPPGPTHS